METLFIKNVPMFEKEVLLMSNTGFGITPPETKLLSYKTFRDLLKDGLIVVKLMVPFKKEELLLNDSFDSSMLSILKRLIKGGFVCKGTPFNENIGVNPPL